MSDVILHHFALSPFAEKVRIGLGLKQAAWKSVDIPIIMPKPDLMPLTGGYRKTPVMQVGADIYCDTQLIMLELERRLPSPPFLLKGREGEARAITMWIDRNMFAPAVGLVMSQIDVAGKFGAGFARDRSDFSGRNFDPERLRAVLPVVRDQAYGQLSLAEAMLADGRRFVLGAEPSMPDCALYNPVWFIQQHLGVAASPLDRLPRIVAWSERMKALGNGKRKDITATEALEIAKSAKPAATSVDTGEPSGLKAGRQISITPDDTGKVPVSGELVGLSADSISIARNDPRVGEVVVHFPRAGFIIHRYSRLENDTRSQRDRGADDYGTQKQMQIDEDRCGSDPVVGASFQKLPGRVSLPSGTRPGSPSSADLWSVPVTALSTCGNMRVVRGSVGSCP